jgi:hypothetical protein
MARQQELPQVDEGDGRDGVPRVGMLENGRQQRVFCRETEEGGAEGSDWKRAVEEPAVLGLEARTEEATVEGDLRSSIGQDAEVRVRCDELELRLPREPGEAVEVGGRKQRSRSRTGRNARWG